MEMIDDKCLFLSAEDACQKNPPTRDKRAANPMQEEIVNLIRKDQLFKLHSLIS